MTQLSCELCLSGVKSTCNNPVYMPFIAMSILRMRKYFYTSALLFQYYISVYNTMVIIYQKYRPRPEGSLNPLNRVCTVRKSKKNVIVSQISKFWMAEGAVLEKSTILFRNKRVNNCIYMPSSVCLITHLEL